MKKILYILLLLLFFFRVYSQNYDLIVTTTGDSIACSIDSITDTEIFFEMKYDYKWIHTHTNINDISSYKLNIVRKKTVSFKPGTSTIGPSIDYYKNIVYPTFGSAIVYMMVNGNYERMIWKSHDRFIHSVWIRVGVGSSGAYEDEIHRNYVATINTYTGRRNAHFELGLGVTHFSGKVRVPTLPAISLGYRHQNLKEHFMFRTGIGWPEALYCSFGYSF